MSGCREPRRMISYYEISHLLFQCAMMILYDRCPPKSQYYFCTGAEEFEETCCERCWCSFLFKVINGEIDMKEDGIWQAKI